jgi:hypothetical protein
MKVPIPSYVKVSPVIIFWVCKKCGKVVQGEMGQVPPKPGCTGCETEKKTNEEGKAE